MEGGRVRVKEKKKMNKWSENRDESKRETAKVRLASTRSYLIVLEANWQV